MTDLTTYLQVDIYHRRCRLMTQVVITFINWRLLRWESLWTNSLASVLRNFVSSQSLISSNSRTSQQHCVNVKMSRFDLRLVPRASPSLPYLKVSKTRREPLCLK